MAIRKVKNGYVVDGGRYVNGERSRVRRVLSTLKDAKDFESDLRKNRNISDSRTLLHLSVRTIRELADYYYGLPRYKALKPRSQVRNRQMIERYVRWCEQNGITYLHEFTKEVAQKYISYIMDIAKGKGQQHHFIAIRMIFTEELERDHPVIQRNPFPKKSPFKKLKYKPIALPEELINILRESMTELEKIFFDLLYLLGCRTGELLYLTWEQIKNGKITFGSHLIYDKNKKSWVEWSTKTEADRTLWLNERSVECFNALRKFKVDHNYVFPDECREISHWSLRSFKKVKKRTVDAHPELKEILFSPDRRKSISPKRFRSTFISHIIRNTNNIEIARIAAGHSSIETTINHYTDSDALDIKSAMNSLNVKNDTAENSDKKSID
jgi:integrase